MLGVSCRLHESVQGGLSEAYPATSSSGRTYCGLGHANRASQDTPNSPVQLSASPTLHTSAHNNVRNTSQEPSQQHQVHSQYPHVSVEAFPTDAKQREKERRKAQKERGKPHEVVKKKKIVEEHYDDCGDNLDSLTDVHETRAYMYPDEVLKTSEKRPSWTIRT